MSNLDEIVAEQEARMERIWQIVNKLTYKEYRKMQQMFQPIEESND